MDICLDWAPGLTQQHGFLHAGMVSTALDSACGYAGLTQMPAGAAVLTIEFKINLLAPAKGQRFRMEGRVIKPGRTITVTEGRAYAIDQGKEKLVATMGCTLMCAGPPRPERLNQPFNPDSTISIGDNHEPCQSART